MASYHHLPPPTDHRSPPLKSPPSDHLLAQNHHLPRRPLTPSSLRDVNLSPNNAARNFNFPSPPTGHDLMAMFPPNPPPALLPGPTSGYFHSQEKAFFSRAGDNSLVRVQIDIDMPMHDMNKGKARAVPVTMTHRQSHSWASPSGSPQHPPHSVQQHHHHPHPHQIPSPPVSHHRSQTIPINTIPVFTGPPQPPHRPQKVHGNTSPDVKAKPSEMIIINDSDESWKTPTPCSERRRKQPRRRTDG